MFRSKTALERAHAAARMIELDGIEGYHTCCERYGEDVANALVVAFLRQQYSGAERPAMNVGQLPIEQTNNALKGFGAFEPQLLEELQSGSHPLP